MERNGIERSHGEALDCQTIGYIIIHGNTYSKYDAHAHSYITQTHTHIHTGGNIHVRRRILRFT